jgi:hypothetical protein
MEATFCVRRLRTLLFATTAERAALSLWAEVDFSTGERAEQKFPLARFDEYKDFAATQQRGSARSVADRHS